MRDLKMYKDEELQTFSKKRSIDNIVTGSSSFQKLVKSSAFVDKTLLIKDIVDSKKAVLLFTCPRRFGKSSNLDMLKTFLEIEVDEEGKEIKDKSQTKNYKLFEKLNIAKDEAFIKDHCGQHPVIFVDFLSVKGNSYEEILDGVKLALHNAFKQHEYLSKSPKLAEDEIELFNEYTHRRKHKKLDNQDVKTGLQFLSEVLHKHFGKRVYVLVDEYDAPVHSAIQEGLDDLTVKNVNGLIDRILCAVLKSNDDHLERGVMTGISGMVRTSASSGLNNVTTYKFLEGHKFAKYYGFTAAEVSELLNGFQVEERKQKEIQTWYDGYFIPYDSRFIPEGGLHIYNPWSILQYLDKGKLGNYWEESGSINNVSEIFKLDEIRDNINQLIRGEDFTFNLETKLTLAKLKDLQKILNCDGKIPEQHSDLFFSYIFELGYLSFVDDQGNYKIPNNEIKSEFANRIINYYIENKILSSRDVKRTVKVLDRFLRSATTDVIEFKESLNTLFKPIQLANIADDQKPGFQPNEDFYHSIINVLAIRSIAEKFGTEVSHNIGKRRADLVLVNGKAKLGVIIELKYGKSTEEALKQIYDRKYGDIFKEYTNIERIKCVGINVSEDKQVDIKCELRDNIITNQNPATTVESVYEITKPHNLHYLNSK